MRAEQPAPVTVEETSEILIVGDSITHASVGDYSWRYFAWQQLRSAKADVDFVGPERDPFVGRGSTWRPRYSDADFDQDHAATWGDRIAFQPLHDRTALMTTYRPDVVVLALGANDLGWMEMDPHDVLPWTRAWLVEARRLVPDVDIVLVDVPWTTSADARTYNSLLEDLAAELDDSRARVIVAAAAHDYQMGRKNGTGDTYDAMHPNTRGQVKIAAAVTDALAELGVGSRYPRPLRFPAEGPRVRPQIQGRSSTTTAKWRWSVPPGTTSFDVWLQRQGKRWVRADRSRSINTYRVKDPQRCEAQTLRVRSRKGWTLAGRDMTTRSLTLRVGPKVSGRATLRGAKPRTRGVAVSWARTRGACAYVVRAVRVDNQGQRIVAQSVVTASRRSTVVRGVRSRTKVRVQVRAMGARNATRWSKTRVVRPR
ncbi:SGNH/GDSL hydrolase family protein [Nocardioides gilvus]|uniref:SGNH/GDSL hydrolase family protein n=1 Tax=Nocardioides gilvus TaxID=1735589 RepID=UPI0013A59663|nr:GDSL-type esterase/lipase family protein [Nocardioides gilvus]